MLPPDDVESTWGSVMLAWTGFDDDSSVKDDEVKGEFESIPAEV